MREQFAGWSYYDNVAVCATCRHKHLIAKAEQVTEQPWLDWLTKHPGHETFIVPYRILEQLDRLAELRHNADVKIAYAASAAYTITLASLATSSTRLAGQESSGLSNATNKYLDELVAGQITTGTTPTVDKLIEIHAIAALDDTPTYPDVFDGTDSAETITSADIKNAICVPIAIIETDATSNRAYPFRPTGLRQFFGDALPVAHSIFVTHDTAVNLNSTAANHFVKHTAIYGTVI